MATKQTSVAKFIEDRYNTPIRLTEHYEAELSTEDEAANLEYEILDGMGPMVEASHEGNMLYFRNDIVAACCCGSKGDYAKVVAGWPELKDKAKFVAGALAK